MPYLALLCRKVVEAEEAAPGIAGAAVEIVRATYAVERQAAEFPSAERLKRRQENSVPVATVLREKLLGWKEQFLQKHPMADGVNDALSQWAELTMFCSNGTVPLDNNHQ